MAIISGIESEYDDFWTLRIDNLGDIYGQKTIYDANIGSLQKENVTYFSKLVADSYKDDEVQIFVAVRNAELLKILIDEVGDLGNQILFFKGGLNEKDIMKIANDNSLQAKLNGHSILHIYDDDSQSTTDYTDIIANVVSSNVNDRLSHDNDVFMYIYCLYIIIFIGLD